MLLLNVVAYKVKMVKILLSKTELKSDMDKR